MSAQIPGVGKAVAIRLLRARMKPNAPAIHPLRTGIRATGLRCLLTYGCSIAKAGTVGCMSAWPARNFENEV